MLILLMVLLVLWNEVISLEESSGTVNELLLHNDKMLSLMRTAHLPEVTSHIVALTSKHDNTIVATAATSTTFVAAW